jgi:pimeloyl-ACP methyl ester carboxylesterase
MMIAIEHADYLRRPADWPVPPSTEGRGVCFLRRVSPPSLVIQGTDDRVASLPNGRAVAEALGADLLERDGAGHAPNLRDPVAVNLVIAAYARRLASVMA